MKYPTIDLELAKKLAQNLMMLQALRKGVNNTAFGTREAICYSEAMTPLKIERETLVEEAFKNG